MLGLSPFGVTTTVTAAKPPTWREKRRMARKERMERRYDGESVMALNDMEYNKGSSIWNINIKRSMTVVVEG
jgi:hypothetical protein